jgi:Zn-dependent M28 family amino/carboxypeptidase
VANLPDADLAKIRLYLNFDMIGSPNYYFGVYDGDESTFDQIDGFVPAGSADIEQTFEDYYDLVGLPYEDTAFSGRSDYRAFIEVGIPSGGLFTGAEDLKSPEQVARYGGTAGVQADPCYHQACDTFDNVNLFALERNSDSVAYSTLTYALSTALPG